ncbi:MAG: type IX secretion system membrane protein PorP/SprF [Cyclobacteriaceae bacterium]
MKHLYIIILLFLSAGQLAAQQEVMYSQYMLNPFVINPAYAGSHESASANLIARKQWAGMEGAPQSQFFSLHSPLKNERAGLGIIVANDRVGVTDQTGVYGAYSYKIPFQKSNLMMGLQMGFSSARINYSRLRIEDATDDNLTTDVINSYTPTVGTGLFYYSERFYAGLSIPQFMRYNGFSEQNISNANQERYYMFNTGYVFDLSRTLKLKPNVLVQKAVGQSWEYDLNLNLLINEVLWLGVSNRSFNSLGTLLDLQLTRQLRFGYAYNWALNEIKYANDGSHELMLNYNFSFYKSKLITPRYF